MCNKHISANAYIEQHIHCFLCRTNHANMFLVDAEYAANAAQQKALSTMTLETFKSEVSTQLVKGVEVQQFSYSVDTVSTPWFAENPNVVPLLKPICQSCYDKSYENGKYIHCHHGFHLFTLQVRRFNCSEPYPPWIKIGE